jgi:hypothetical protein
MSEDGYLVGRTRRLLVELVVIAAGVFLRLDRPANGSGLDVDLMDPGFRYAVVSIPSPDIGAERPSRGRRLEPGWLHPYKIKPRLRLRPRAGLLLSAWTPDVSI